VLAVAVYDVQASRKKIFRVLVPVGLLTDFGVRLAFDNGSARRGHYNICLPNGCFAEVSFDDASLRLMRRSESMKITVANQNNQQVTFVAPIEGFSEAFDGPGVSGRELQDRMKNN
jgi:invasion protein IalB